MAKIWNLPAIFVCENNHYAMGTAAERGCANTDFYTRGDHIPGIRVDGMDVLAVREATKFARKFASSGNGPIILECVTYRFCGHSMVDPDTTYRTHEEVERMQRTEDPINLLKDRLLSSELSTEEELQNVEEIVESEIAEATELAKAHLEPGLEELAADVYTENLGGPIRGVTSHHWMEHKNIGKRINWR
jgi:pyruvate dehydrogenase E1 component alpha subunit